MEVLDRKYKTEDVGSKKFMVDHFLDYKMMNIKSVINQVQELRLILHEVHTKEISLTEHIPSSHSDWEVA